MDISILCVTYNHEKYIRKALDGFLMQEGDFSYEILIHDDASTDGTVEILKEYKKQYPDKITLVLQEENQCSKGKDVVTSFLYPLIQGKYVAFCDGDDAWIYEKKLQRQYEWMESNPDVSMCLHNAIRVNLAEKEFIPQVLDMDSGYMQDEEIIFSKKGRIPTASFFFRAENIKKLPGYCRLAPVWDDSIKFLCASRGKIYYMDKVWSIRNYMHEGSWNKSMEQDDTFRYEHYKEYSRFLAEFNKETDGRFEKDVKELLFWQCTVLAGRKEPSSLTCQAFEEVICECQKGQDLFLKNIFTAIKAFRMPECLDYLEYIKGKAAALSESQEKFYIYGAGQIAKEQAEMLIENHINFHGFVVSSREGNKTEYMGRPVYDIREIQDSDRTAYYWLCMNEANRAEVIPVLISLGIKNLL